jgi:hypothetical protein
MGAGAASFCQVSAEQQVAENPNPEIAITK